MSMDDSISMAFARLQAEEEQCEKDEAWIMSRGQWREHLNNARNLVALAGNAEDADLDRPTRGQIVQWMLRLAFDGKKSELRKMRNSIPERQWVNWDFPGGFELFWSDLRHPHCDPGFDADKEEDTIRILKAAGYPTNDDMQSRLTDDEVGGFRFADDDEHADAYEVVVRANLERSPLRQRLNQLVVDSERQKAKTDEPLQDGEHAPRGSGKDNSSSRRSYVKQADAERRASELFSQLWPSSNQSHWAENIGIDRSRVKNLKAWHRAEKRRVGWKQLATRLKGSVDPKIIEALETSDASVIGSLSAGDRDRIDGMPDSARQEIMDILYETARDAES